MQADPAQFPLLSSSPDSLTHALGGETNSGSLLELGGNTMTGDAISYTTTNIFTERNGARPAARGIQRVAILLTDGRSQDYVLEPSKAAAKAGIRMFAVGIGEALKVELEEIAAEPKNAHVFHVTDFNAIDKIRGRLRRRLCESKSAVGLGANTSLALHATWLLFEAFEVAASP